MSILVDGKAIAEDIARQLSKERQRLWKASTPGVHSLMERAKVVQPSLAIISVAPNFATTKYLGIKQRFAERIGVTLALTELLESATTEDVVSAIALAQNSHGIVLQLPFPEHIDVEAVLAALPEAKDVDVIGAQASAAFALGDHSLMPPVVGAISEIAERHSIDFTNTKVCVIGKGRLVGAPAALWAKAQGAQVTVVDKEDDIKTAVRDADIVILGAGSPSLLAPNMLKPGAAIFDAGTSEDGGKLAGDADPTCRDVASLFTPVPGGIGPVAVAKLFENLLVLAEKRK